MRFISIYVLVILVALSGKLSAQVTLENAFSESLEAGDDIIEIFDHVELTDGVIVGVKYSQVRDYSLGIIKVDTTGGVIWSTYDQGYDMPGFRVHLMEGMDGIYYAAMEAHNDENYIWSLDSSGTVLVDSLLPASIDGISNLSDYNNDKFLLSYSDGSSGDAGIAEIDKLTGDTLKTEVVNNNNGGEVYVEADMLGNVYLVYNHILTKYSGDNYSYPIWSRNFYSASIPSEEIQGVYCDYIGNVFVFVTGGTFNHGPCTIYKIDPNDGEELWAHVLSNHETEIIALRDYNGFLYTAHRHTLVGGGNSYLNTSKINKSTGVLEWMVNLSASDPITGNPMSTYHKAILSIDVDCHGDVYTTGYHWTSNYGPGAWIIVKLDGNNGNRLVEYTVIIDSTSFNNTSTGSTVSVIDERPIILGLLEDGMGTTKGYYVEMNPPQDSIHVKKPLSTSVVVRTHPVDFVSDEDTLYALMQYGRYSKLNALNSSLDLIWDTVLFSNKHLLPNSLLINDSSLFVISEQRDSISFSPYIGASADTLQFYYVNKFNGNVIDSAVYAMQAGDTAVHVIDAIQSDGIVYVLVSRNSEFELYMWDGGIIQRSGITFGSHSFNWHQEENVMLDYNSTTLLISLPTGLYQVNKTTLAASLIDTYQADICYELSSSYNNIYTSYSYQDSAYVIAYDASSFSQQYTLNLGYGYPANLCSDAFGAYVLLCKPDSSLSVVKVNGNGTVVSVTNNLVASPGSKYIATDMKFINEYSIAVSGQVRLNNSNKVSQFLKVLNNSGLGLIYSEFKQTPAHSWDYKFPLHVLNDSTFYLGGTVGLISCPLCGKIWGYDYDLDDINISTEDNLNELSINLFPNPTRGELHIELLGDELVYPFSIEIMDSRSRIIDRVSDISSQKFTINVSNYAKGIYSIRIRPSNDKTYVKKFVVG